MVSFEQSGCAFNSSFSRLLHSHSRQGPGWVAQPGLGRGSRCRATAAPGRARVPLPQPWPSLPGPPCSGREGQDGDPGRPCPAGRQPAPLPGRAQARCPAGRCPPPRRRADAAAPAQRARARRAAGAERGPGGGRDEPGGAGGRGEAGDGGSARAVTAFGGGPGPPCAQTRECGTARPGQRPPGPRCRVAPLVPPCGPGEREAALARSSLRQRSGFPCPGSTRPR